MKNKIFSSGAGQKGKQSSGAKKNARLRSKKTSNLKKGLNPNTLKSFMILHFYGNPETPRVVVKDLCQTRIGAVKAKKALTLKTNGLPYYNSYHVLPLSRGVSWLEHKLYEKETHIAGSSKRKVEIAKLQKEINATKRVIKAINNGEDIKDKKGKTVTVYMAKKVLFNAVDKIKKIKKDQNRKFPDLTNFSESLENIKKHYGIQTKKQNSDYIYSINLIKIVALLLEKVSLKLKKVAITLCFI